MAVYDRIIDRLAARLSEAQVQVSVKPSPTWLGW